MLKEKLISFRKEAGYTQQEIADLIGVERSTYACYETGKALIPINKLQLLAIIYHIGLEAFNTTNVLPLHDDFGAKPEPKNEIGRLTREERMYLAQIRLIEAMGKQEELQKLLNQFTEEE